MNILLIFIWVWGAFIAMSFWESSVEGRNAWDKGKLGWKIKLGRYVVLTKYHFSVNIMHIFFLTLPFVIYGWNLRLFGIIFSAAASGMVIEDFMWFVVNPVVKLSEFNPQFASYYPWFGIGKFKLPTFYFIGIGLSLLSWWFIWRV